MIFGGSTKIKDVYAGSTAVKAVYAGNLLVWSAAKPAALPCLTFTAEQANSTVKIHAQGSAPAVNLQTSTDGSTWTPYSVETTLTLANVGDKVMFKAVGQNQKISSASNAYNGFVMTGKIAASGNVNSLLEEDEATAETMSLAGRDYCYAYLFYYCGSLTSAPELPAKTLASACYISMFQSCTSLTVAPELPATTLTGSCYNKMFSSCTRLTTAPELPATTLAGLCYSSMFGSCTSLTTAPELPATKLASYCYGSMFYGCRLLTSAPELPAQTLASFCYDNMFNGCTNLKIREGGTEGTKVLDLPAGTTQQYGWSDSMFSNTGGTFKGSPQIGKAYYCYQ